MMAPVNILLEQLQHITRPVDFAIWALTQVRDRSNSTSHSLPMVVASR